MFRIHKKPLKDKYERLRGQAKVRNLSSEGYLRLEWIIAYQKGNKVKDICEQFGISKSNFYKWKQRFQAHNILSLETLSNTPKKFRSRIIDPIKEERVIKLRKKYSYYGKMKLQVLYKNQYKEHISSWYIQKVIENYSLYPPRRKHKGTTQKRLYYNKKTKSISLLFLSINVVFWSIWILLNCV